jgi:hypothetical protein
MDLLRNPSEFIHEELKEREDTTLRDASMSPLGDPSNMFGQIPTDGPPSSRIKVDIIQSKITSGLNSFDARLIEDLDAEQMQLILEQEELGRAMQE